jgi:hypothetical protein
MKMSYWDVMKEIEKFPHFREFACSNCGRNQKVFALLIHYDCEYCGTSYKLRCQGSIGTEIEDVIDSVLQWPGAGEEFKAAMKWKQLREAYPDENDE